mmetsp:Transcript_30121/g.30607  ORF Transcript_30121/g.30607 Transcript_30121/m.30607 type:complete len:392 (+) Transcript_30121:128-1303(+)
MKSALIFMMRMIIICIALRLGLSKIDITEAEMEEMENMAYYSYGTVVSTDFNVVVEGRTIDMVNLSSNFDGLSSNYSIKGTKSSGGDFVQRIFKFSSKAYSNDEPYENTKSYDYFFHLPVAGQPIVDDFMLFFYTISWNTPADAWQCDPIDNTKIYNLGVYDPSTWRQNTDGSLTVSFLNGQYAAIGTGCTRQFILTFICGENIEIAYSHYEEPACFNYCNVTSSMFCSAASLPEPSTSPSLTPTVAPSTPSPTHVPFVVPINQAPSMSAPGNYCISLFLLNDTRSSWNSTAMDVLNVDNIPYYQLTPGCSMPYANSLYCFSTDIAMTGKFLVTRVAVFEDSSMWWMINWKAKNSTNHIYYGEQITPMVYADKPPAVNGVETSKVFVGACM